MKLINQEKLNIETKALLISCGFAAFLYFNRFMIPDISFDTFQYHLFHGYRGLSHFLMPSAPGEFFPTMIGLINPIYDSLHFFFVQQLGYRLGHIAGLFANILVAFYVIKIARLLFSDFLKTEKTAAFLLLLNALIIFHMWLQLATYMVETMNAIPMLMGFYYWLRALIHHEEGKTNFAPSIKLLLIAHFLWGVACLGKPVNLYTVGPLLTASFLLVFFGSPFKEIKIIGKTALCAVLALVTFALVAIYWFHIYQLTGNPVFPFYNEIFKSPFLEPTNLTFKFWSEKPLYEKIIWPLGVWDFKDLFESFDRRPAYLKFLLYWILAWFLLIVPHRGNRGVIKKLTFLFLACCFSWSLETGIIRYIIWVEVLGSMLMIHFFAVTSQKPNDAGNGRAFQDPIVCTCRWFFAVSLVVINGFFIKTNLNEEVVYRPTFMENPGLHKAQLPYLFMKQIEFPEDAKAFVEQVDFNINCQNAHIGLYAISPLKDKPVLTLTSLELYRPYEKVFNQLRDQKADREGKVTIALLARSQGKRAYYEACRERLEKENPIILKKFTVHNFMGDKRQEVTLLIGRL